MCHVGVGWGVSCRGSEAAHGVGWGRVGWVGHEGVGWGVVGWGRVGWLSHEGVRWDGVGWVM